MLTNKNIDSFLKLEPPSYFLKTLKITKDIEDLILRTRGEIEDIINKKSKKLLFIVGPCSIHDSDAALEYGRKLKELSDEVSEKILIVMRVYFEKPRTTIGWKGLINDPYLDNSFKVNDGLFKARKLLLELNKIGMPCGYEVLDPITPQYITDLISWGAIGARTTESQVHRQLVSGLSMPVGFKNGTGGSIKIARDAILSAKFPHCFMGIGENGAAAICRTKGNNNCHLILRGGSRGPNYTSEYLDESEKLLKENSLSNAIMVDCSHGNSLKNHKNQERVLKYVINETKNRDSIMGVMIESNINEGKQKLGKELLYGVSITDSCLSFSETSRIIKNGFLNL
jgi:3-deoxy-7-phosphoheptulonate synthase